MKIVVVQSFVDPALAVPSPSDQAALELALQLGEASGSGPPAGEVTAVCVGPAEAGELLRDAIAVGAHHAIHVPTDTPHVPDARAVAAALFDVCEDADLVLCGHDPSVPAFLASMLRRPQVLDALKLGLVDGLVSAECRADRGRVSVYSAPLPAVVSVAGSIAMLRRASLPALLAAKTAVVEQRHAVSAVSGISVSAPRPMRQRTKVVAAPSSDSPRERVLSITKATEASDPPRTLKLEPTEAAAEAVEALRQWGYL